MRLKFIPALLLAASTMAVAAAPVVAEAKTRHRVEVCKNVRAAANRGTAVGALGGALLGNVVAGHGAKTEGTVLGAGVGAVAGHQIAKNKAKRECHYEYRYY